MRPNPASQLCAALGQDDGNRPAVPFRFLAHEQALCFEAIEQPRHIVAFDHDSLCEVANAQTASGTLKLKQDVVPSERR